MPERRPLFGRSYVRVRFPGTDRLYTYYCPGARVGDEVEVPPTMVSWRPQTVRVVARGRRWWGHVKEARLRRRTCPNRHSFPDQIAVGCEVDGCAASVVCVPIAEVYRLREAARVLIGAYMSGDDKALADAINALEAAGGFTQQGNAST